MENLIRLSIIVPVYNVAHYIPKCLDSLLLQDIAPDEYEIVCVNDGSTDSSSEILELYAKENQNIRVISQENQGLGGARNTGILHADGKYIMFVDSDDYIEKNCLSILLEKIEKNNLDILRYNYEEVDTNYQIISKKRNATHAVIFKDDIVDGKEFLSERMGWACYVWAYLYKASLLKEGAIYFVKGIHFEDIEWLPRVLLHTERVGSINKHLYNYVKRPGSITQSYEKWKLEKSIQDRMMINDKLKRLFAFVSDSKVTLWYKGASSLTVMSILSIAARYMPEEKNRIIKELKDKELFPLVTYNFTIKQSIYAFIINVNPSLFCYLKSKVDILNWIRNLAHNYFDL